MSVSYLRAFLDASEALPFDVQPQITDYREKDAEFQQLKAEITEATEKILSLEGSVATIQQLEILQGLVTRAAEIATEKLHITQEISKTVDTQYDGLERAASDYTSGAYIQKEKKAALAAQEKAAPRKKQAADTSDKPAKRKRTENKKKSSASESKSKSEKEKEAEYCVPSCKVSGEEMVGCDNDKCTSGQWFHLSCVGLKSAPVASTWYCQWCRPSFRKR